MVIMMKTNDTIQNKSIVFSFFSWELLDILELAVLHRRINPSLLQSIIFCTILSRARL